MKENPELFSAAAIESVRNYLKIQDEPAAIQQINYNSTSINDHCNVDFSLNDSMKNLEITKCATHNQRNCSTDDITVHNENCNEKKVRFDTDSHNDHQ